MRLCGAPHNRKNWLFAGSDEGAERAAIIYTIIETTIRHGHEPYAYLRDVLDKLGRGWPQKQLDELLPDRWALPDADAPGSAHEVRDSSVTTSASSPP